MQAQSCDFCGSDLLLARQRYTSDIKIVAAYDVMELTENDLKRDLKGEIEDLMREIEGCDEEELNESVYKSFKLDLCTPCQKHFIKDIKSRLFRQA